MHFSWVVVKINSEVLKAVKNNPSTDLCTSRKKSARVDNRPSLHRMCMVYIPRLPLTIESLLQLGDHSHMVRKAKDCEQSDYMGQNKRQAISYLK